MILVTNDIGIVRQFRIFKRKAFRMRKVSLGDISVKSMSDDDHISDNDDYDDSVLVRSVIPSKIF